MFDTQASQRQHFLPFTDHVHGILKVIFSKFLELCSMRRFWRLINLRRQGIRYDTHKIMITIDRKKSLQTNTYTFTGEFGVDFTDIFTFFTRPHFFRAFSALSYRHD